MNPFVDSKLEDLMTVRINQRDSLLSLPQRSSNTNQNQGISPSPSPAPSWPDPYPSHICGEPKTVAIHDEQLGLCYDVTVPCGGTPEQAAERFRLYIQARQLNQNAAARIHQTAVQRAPASPAPEGSISGSDILQGLLMFLLGPLAMSGCSTADPNVPVEIPDASAPPPSTDSACEARRSQIMNTRPDASLESMVRSLSLPSLDVTYEGNAFLQDSTGAVISRIQCSDPVSWAQVGDKLFVLTANRISGGYSPATLLVYQINAEHSLTPVTTRSIANGGASNAILFPGQFNPVAMDSMIGNTELDVLFGAPSAGEIATLDPFSLSLTQADWCSTHVATDGGTEVGDAGTDVRSDGGMDGG